MPRRAPQARKSFSSFIPPWFGSSDLYTQIVVQFLDVGIQLGVGELVDDTPMFHDVIAVRNGRSEAEILFHQQDRETLLFQRANGAADLLDNDRRQPFSRLVEQQHARAGAQNAADRQ